MTLHESSVHLLQTSVFLQSQDSVIIKLGRGEKRDSAEKASGNLEADRSGY